MMQPQVKKQPEYKSTARKKRIDCVPRRIELPEPAFLVDTVKLQGSPDTPWTRPEPYAVTKPEETESTWNLKGDPVKN